MKKILLTIYTLLFFSSALLYAQSKPNIPLDYGFNVGSYTGSLNYERMDIFIPGKGLPLEAVFSYNGMLRYKDFGYGSGWTFTYNYNYSPDTLGVMIVHRSTGSEHSYTPGSNGYIPPQGTYDEFEEYAPGKFSLTMKEDQTVYYFDDASHGKLTSIVERNGNTVMLSYTDSLLNTVTDATGRTLQFAWQNGKLASITENNTALTRTFTYEYNDAGQMIKMTNPLSYELNFGYDEYGKMTSYTDEIGTPMTIEYNGNAAVKKVNTCLTTMQFTYDLKNRKTFVVETVGGERFVTTYRFDEEGRNVEQTGSCCGNTQALVYDDNNNVVSRTDGNGMEDTYLYDANGNIRKRTDPDGNVEDFLYDLTLNKLIWEKDFLGNIFNYAYDGNGNLTTANFPLNISESYTYNGDGQRTSFTDGNNNTTTFEYDQYGNLTTTTNPDNTSYENVYDAIGNLISETDENGNTTTYEYDAMNRMVKEMNALGYTKTAVYDGVGNVVEYFDENGNSTLYEYDGLRRLTSTTTPEGIIKSKEYDSRGNVAAEIDGNGGKTTMTYNDLNQMLTKTDPAGNTVYYEYDAVGNKISESDKLGNVMTYTYDNKNRLVKKTDPLGNTYSFEYDVLGRKIVETDARGNSMYFEYDALGRVIKETDALGNFETYVYDAVDNLTERTDKNGNTFKYFFDNRDRLIKREYPSQRITEYTYDDVGNQLTRTRAAGIVIQFVYDALNQLISQTNPSGEIATFEYDSLGTKVQEGFPNGQTVFMEYDKDRRLVKEYDNEGLIAAYTYDGNNKIIQEMDADSTVTINRYDKLSNLIESEDALGNIEYLEYDANGQLIKQTDRAGNEKVFTYNALGAIIAVQDGTDRLTSIEFDAMGNMIKATDPSDNTTSYTYDALHRQTQILYPDGTAKEYEYDPNGNIIKRTDADDTITNYTYDEQNRQRAKIYADGSSCTFDYDSIGRMVTATNPNVTVQFEYDLNSRLAKEIVGAEEINYSYDVPNRKKTITYPGGRIVEEEMDFRSRTTLVKQNSTTVASLAYQGYDIVQKAFNNGLTTSYDSDELGRTESITVNPGAVFHFKYQFDNLGNKTNQETLHRQESSETYAYDGLDRLINYKKGQISNSDIPSPSNQIDFQYDALGNRMSVTEDNNTTTYAANNLNAYTSIERDGNIFDFQYSLTGNLTTDGQNTYTYDADNRLTSLNNNAFYKYDALGRRYQKIIGGTTTTYYYYSDQLIQETDNNGITTEYIYAGGRDYRLAMINSSGTYYYHMNTIASVVGMSNEAGQVVERYEYTPYGTPFIYDNDYNELAASQIGNKFFFTGKELDDESDLYYSRSRYYSHILGRFLQRDPISYQDGMNLYQYVGSNPTNYLDPLGLKTCASFSYGKDAGKRKGVVGRAFGRLGSAVLSASVGFTIKGETCRECCSKTKSYGWKYSASLTVTGSAGYSINGLNFFPQARAIVLAARFARVEIFAGVEVRGQISGSVSVERDACGDWSGGGCVNGSVSISGRISVSTLNEFKRDKNGNEKKNPRDENAGIGGSISGSYNLSACYKKKGGNAFKWECESYFSAEAKVWLNVEGSFLGVDVSISEEYSKTWEPDDKSAACPGWLPTF